MTERPLGHRPRITIPYSKLEVTCEIIAAVAVAACGVMPFIYWQQMPDVIPTHFDAGGTADGWGSKNTLLIMPVVVLLMYAGMTLLQRYPHIYNYPFALTEKNVKTMYHLSRTMMIIIKAEMAATFAILQWQTTMVATGNIQSLNHFYVLSIVALMFASSGYMIYLMYTKR